MSVWNAGKASISKTMLQCTYQNKTSINAGNSHIIVIHLMPSWSFWDIKGWSQ